MDPLALVRLVVRQRGRTWLLWGLGALLLSLVVTPSVRDSQAAAREKPLPPRVELAGERTATSRTYRNPDGSFTTSLFSRPVNYRDAKGNWQAIDSSLVASRKDGYLWGNEANRFRADLKLKSDGELLSFDAGDEAAFTMRLAGAARIDGGKARDNSFLYRGVLPATDLEYELLPEGVKETIILRNGEAPASFRFVLTPTGQRELRAVARDDGSVAFYAGGGEPAFTLAAPIVRDSRAAEPQPLSDSPEAPAGSTPAKGGKPPERPPAPLEPGSGPVAAGKVTIGVQRQADGSFAVNVRVDEQWLRDPKRVFPVVVDPTITTQADIQDGYWNTSSGSSLPNMSDSELVVGRDGSGGNKYAAPIKFNLGAVPPGARVVAAKFDLFWTGCVPPLTGEYDPFGCPYWWTENHYDGTVQVKRLTSAWSGSTQWSSVTADANLLGSFGLAVYITADQPQGWRSLGNSLLAAQMQQMVNGTLPNHGFLFEKTGGNDNVGFKFASSRNVDVSKHPRLDIEWVAEGVQLDEPRHLHSDGAELVWQRYSGGLGPYGEAVIADAPAAYWRFNDPPGTLFGVTDWTGNGQNAVASGPVAFAEPGATADRDQSWK